MKLKLPVSQASAVVLDGLFKQLDKRWEEILEQLTPLLKAANVHPKEHADFAKFQFSLAVIAVNIRTSFDVLPHGLAEEVSKHTFLILEKSFGPKFPVVKSSLFKFIEAYDTGIVRIRNPLIDVGMLLYYKIGLHNIEEKVVDEGYYVPAPRVVEYLSNVLMMFTGRWEFLIQRYQIIGKSGHSPDEDGPGV